MKNGTMFSTPISKPLRAWITSCIVVVLLLGNSVQSPAQVSGEVESCDPSFLERLGSLGLVVVTSVGLHELGHYTVANLAGARHVEMVFLTTYNDEFLVAANLIDTTGLTDFDNAAIGLAGVGTTRLMAESAHLISTVYENDTTCPGFIRQTLSGLYLFGRFDFPLYVLQDATLNLAGEPGSDIDHVVTAVAGKGTWGRVAVYGGLLAVAGLDLWLDRNRILYHIDVLSGDPSPGNDEADGLFGFEVRPALAPDFLGIQLAAHW